ncbi:MAG: hypothetical protein ACOCQX_03455 [Candidatus Nanoarchaeia archaeon]
MVSERIILGIVGLSTGLLAGIFAYLLQKVTKGAIKGWLYISLEGAALFCWGLFWSLSNFFDYVPGKMLATGIFVPFIAFFASIGYTSIAKQFGVNMPKWLNVRNVVILNVVAYFILGIYNYFFSAYSSLAGEIGTVGLFQGGLGMLVGSISAFYVFKGTRRYIWLSQGLYTIFCTIGLWSLNYTALCCWEQGPLNSSEVCSSLTYEYLAVFQIPCLASIIPITDVFYNFMAIGLIMFAISLIVFWWRLK